MQNLNVMVGISTHAILASFYTLNLCTAPGNNNHRSSMYLCFHIAAHGTSIFIFSNTHGVAACPGEELVLTCIAHNTVALRWRVHNSLHGHGSSIEHTFTHRDTPGARRALGDYLVTLISNANHRYESKLSTVAVWSSHNTFIECISVVTKQSFTIKIEGNTVGKFLKANYWHILS